MIDPNCTKCWPNHCVHGEQCVTADDIVLEQLRTRVKELEEQHAHRDKVNAEKREQWEALKAKLVTTESERDGAIAEAAAAKRERDAARAIATLDKVAVALAAKEEEREACAQVAWNNEPDGRLAAAIRARGAGMTEDEWLSKLAAECRCCQGCWDVPCGGCQQGAPCDAMDCRCDDGSDFDEPQSSDDLDAEGELP